MDEWISELMLVLLASLILIVLIAVFYVNRSTPMDMIHWIADVIDASRVPV